LPDCKIVK